MLHVYQLSEPSTKNKLFHQSFSHSAYFRFFEFECKKKKWSVCWTCPQVTTSISQDVIKFNTFSALFLYKFDFNDSLNNFYWFPFHFQCWTSAILSFLQLTCDTFVPKMYRNKLSKIINFSFRLCILCDLLFDHFRIV